MCFFVSLLMMPSSREDDERITRRWDDVFLIDINYIIKKIFNMLVCLCFFLYLCGLNLYSYAYETRRNTYS